MRIARTTTIAFGAAAALLGTAGSVTATASDEPARQPGWQVPVYAGPGGSAPTVIEDTAATKAAPTVQFKVTYVGFSAPAKAAFQRAVNKWAAKLSSPVPITVRASWEPLGSNILGSAGPSYGWTMGGVIYIDAIANKKAGRDLDSAPDIVARFSSNFSNWHFGTGPAPRGKYDFESVVMHELGHGVGFLGAGRVNGNLGTVRFSGKNISYDRFTKLGSQASSPLLWKMPDNSVKLGNALRSNNVYFDSTKVRAANGGRAAKLYAPGAWRQGSSYSHLDESTYPQGNPNSLMTYAINDGETIRSQGKITMALLKSIGW
ncbi:MAG: hypothetical protein V9G19_07935 [Tetrasphaera sp.]